LHVPGVGSWTGVHARAKSVHVTVDTEADPPSTMQLPPTGADDEIWKLVQGDGGTVAHAVEVSGASPASALQPTEQTVSE
jgi:hypothetical protein